MFIEMELDFHWNIQCIHAPSCPVHRMGVRYLDWEKSVFRPYGQSPTGRSRVLNYGL
ncbi:hypothetical protein JCM16138_24430 [Thermococcus atlanticus]